MISLHADSPPWAHALARRLDEELYSSLSQPVALARYSVADLPDATRFRACVIYVTDETDGAVPAFSDGADWRRVTDRTVVS